MGDWMALYRCRAARRLGAQTGIDPTAQKLKANQIHGSKRGCPTGCQTEGPDGVVPKADRMNACQIYSSNSWCPTGGRTGCRTGDQTGGPTGARRGARRGARQGQTECLTGCPTGPDKSHVIGHIIFECHVTRLGWQGVILLSTLLSQR
jgi:hypothetical protein